VVDPSAWEKASKMLVCFSTAMPMPVSRTSKCRSTQSDTSPSTHLQDHLAARGNDGIADEVQQHLPEPAGVADDHAGHIRPDATEQLQPLLTGREAEDLIVSSSMGRSAKWTGSRSSLPLRSSRSRGRR
jgi:hypothetical protein